jgi:CRP-like cAMP-binding protein
LSRKLSRWIALPEADQQMLETLPGHVRGFARGDRPLVGIDPTSCTLLMLEGWAAEYKDTPHGRRVIVEYLLPGDFRLSSPHRDRTLDMVMLSQGVVQLVPQDAMERLRARDAIRRALEWTESVRSATQAEWLVNIGARKAYARLAHLLCELAVRMNSVDMLDANVCELPLTQIDLAASLAMSNVHLNLALQRLRAAKLVEVSARRLTILKRAELEAIAGFDDSYLLRWPTALPDRRVRNALPPGQKERRRAGGRG